MNLSEETCANNSGLDDWFNELDEESMEIINKNLILEEELKEELVTDIDNITETEYIYVEDIINKNSIDMDSFTIIQYNCGLAHCIKSLMDYIKNNFNFEYGHSDKINYNTISSQSDTFKPNINYLNDTNDFFEMDKLNDIIIYLKWISNSSIILSNRIGQSIIQYDHSAKVGIPAIIRSSYNFCTDATRCKNFYNKNEIPTCTKHHYVHSLLKYDIDSVVAFLTYIINENIQITKEYFDDLYLSIKTIYYVSKHMQKEISRSLFSLFLKPITDLLSITSIIRYFKIKIGCIL